MSGKKSVSLNAALNVLKQICAVIFPMITFPYVSRVLGAEIYGKINFSSSIISYISLIAALGITSYAIRECAGVKNDPVLFKKKVNELFSINLSTTVVSYIVLIGLLLFWPKLKGYEAILLIQSVYVIFTTIGTDWINVIYEDYAYITIRYLICQSIAVLSTFILVRNEGDYLLYAVVSILGSVLANICNFFYIRKKLGVKPRFIINMNIREHYKPILILFGSAVASLIYINSDVTILGILKDDTEVGYYSVSAKIYGLVKQIINAALMVFLPRISKEVGSVSRKQIETRFSKLINILLIFIAPACAGLFMLSKNIVLLFSGMDYISAYSSLRLLAFSLPFASLACFYINIVMIPYKMEKKVLIATSVSAVLNIVLNIIFIPMWGQDAAAGTTLLAEVVMLVSGIIFTRKIISIKIYKGLLCAFIETVGTGLLCYLCLNIIDGVVLQIIVSIAFAAVFCGVVAVAMFSKDLKGLLKKDNYSKE